MPKQKKLKLPYLLPTLYASIAILIVLSLFLAIALVRENKANPTDIESPSVSLGSMQYDFSSGKAVKRNDASVKTLQAFLEADAAREGCPNQIPAFEHVAAYTKDETQVFIKYGCGAADSPMYAVKTDGAWKTLSPTNHFDTFGIPNCKYLTDNDISKEIAPVCVNITGPETPASYSVR
jgi:hypothetical protein